MRNFREEYRNELDQVPTGDLSAERILAAASGDGARESAARRAWRLGKTWTRVAAAAAVLIVCSAGTVTAVNIHRSYIRVEEDGYRLSRENPDETVQEPEEESAPVSELPEEGCYFEEILDEGREYASLDEFRANEEIDFICPEPEWLLGESEPQQETVYVSDDGSMVSYILVEDEKRQLLVNQWDTREAEDYSSATSYDGKSANERTYVTEKGFDFLLFDSVENGRTLSTHAVISLNGRELSLDFYGYPEETIENVLEKLDLEIYLK